MLGGGAGGERGGRRREERRGGSRVDWGGCCVGRRWRRDHLRRRRAGMEGGGRRGGWNSWGGWVGMERGRGKRRGGRGVAEGSTGARVGLELDLADSTFSELPAIDGRGEYTAGRGAEGGTGRGSLGRDRGWSHCHRDLGLPWRDVVVGLALALGRPCSRNLSWSFALPSLFASLPLCCSWSLSMSWALALAWCLHLCCLSQPLGCPHGLLSGVFAIGDVT
jgi:hypothetical protein